jgi:hypothetical protein
MTAAVVKKAVRWHKLPFTQFLVHESKREYFQPFLVGGAYVASLTHSPAIAPLCLTHTSYYCYSLAWVICGVLPTRGATQEDKEKSNYWKRINGKFDYSHH